MIKRFLKTTVPFLALLLVTHQSAAADTPTEWMTLEVVDGYFYICTIEECTPLELPHALREYLIENPEVVQEWFIRLLVEEIIENSARKVLQKVEKSISPDEPLFEPDDQQTFQEIGEMLERVGSSQDTY